MGDIRNDPEFRYADVLREHGIVSVCNTPIFVNGSHWGVLEVDAEEKTAFDEFEVFSLSIFANIIGLSLARHFAEADVVKANFDTSASKSQSEILLRELQHRMKNNLQLIVSFLELQKRQTNNEEARDRIAAVLDRVLAIGLAHDQLTFKISASSVNMQEYLAALCANLDPQRPNIAITVNVEPVGIPLDRAVPIGLIVNELVTNSLKYAFDEGGGTIAVAFRADKLVGEAELTVRDTGRGMKDARPGAFGLRLVEMLAGQLGGTLMHDDASKGTVVTIRVPYSI